MAFIRWTLGRLILLLNAVFSPRGIKREPEQQQKIDSATRSLTLYQYPACPFCVKVRRSMKRQTLNIKTRDARRGSLHAEELLSQGGKLKVPCLRIENTSGDVQWLYESKAVISYLQQQFSATTA